MSKRKSVPKKTRFEVFKRDLFTCQYCGRSTPQITLELDHIEPVSKGGDNSDYNLITSCFDCNRGKSDTQLTEILPPLVDRMQQIKEKEDQLKEYNKLTRSIKRRKKSGAKKIEAVFKAHYETRGFTDEFIPSVVNFIEALGIEAVLDNIEKACSRTDTSDHACNYFCKMCWNQIKGVTGYGQ